MPDGRLLCYKKGAVLVLKDNKIDKIVPIPINTKERLLGWSRLMSRLFRFGVRSSIALDNETAILNIGNSLFELDVESGKLSTGWYCGDRIRPLVLTKVEDISGFDNGIYFGGYIHNFEKNPVNIYKRNGFDDWGVVYTFPKGTINHVHNIIPDPFHDCLWVMTGDFEESAAIWRVEDRFNKVECFVSGNQKYRGCVAFATQEGLLYATDAPFAQNNVYLLKDDRTVINVCDLSGSCIYGSQWNNNYVFSTVVEPDGRNETMLRLFFGWKRGQGIKDNNARIYNGNLNEGFKEIYKLKKDVLPFIFQFAAFKLPSGKNNTNTLLFQPVATMKNDMELIGIQIV